jgi:hypothetical protein
LVDVNLPSLSFELVIQLLRYIYYFGEDFMKVIVRELAPIRIAFLQVLAYFPKLVCFNW